MLFVNESHVISIQQIKKWLKFQSELMLLHFSSPNHFFKFIETDSAGFRTLIEEFTNVDNEKYVKEAEVIEAGYLDLRFNYYRVRFEIVEKGDE